MPKKRLKPFLVKQGIQFLDVKEQSLGMSTRLALRLQAQGMQKLIDASAYKGLIVPIVDIGLDNELRLDWGNTTALLDTRHMRWIPYRLFNVAERLSPTRIKERRALFEALDELAIYRPEHRFQWFKKVDGTPFENEYTK